MSRLPYTGNTVETRWWFLLYILGLILPENQESARNVLLAEPNVLAMVNFDESLARQNRTWHYRR